MVMLS
jgi:hypothetical protein